MCASFNHFSLTYSSNEYPTLQASTLGRPSLIQNQAPQMYRQSSATPPSSMGSRQSTPPSQYGVMTRPSARPPSPPLPPPPIQGGIQVNMVVDFRAYL